MNKQEFLEKLRLELGGLPQDEIDERINFYSEIIDDRTEDGLSEDMAVNQIGPVEEIVRQIVADIPLTKLAKARIKPKRRLRVWEIILLVLGSPVWLSLLIAAVAVIFSLYVSLWAIIISLWAVFGALIGGAFGGVAAGVVFALNGNIWSGAFMLAAGFICAGLSIFMFYGCKAATTGTLLLTRKIAIRIKKCFVKKEEAQ